MKKLSTYQNYLISKVLCRFEDFVKNNKRSLELVDFEFNGITYQVWRKDLDEIKAIINCIVEAL